MPQHARFSSRQHEAVVGGTVERLLRKASAHLEAGRLGEAERLYQRLLKSEPGHAGAIYKLGLIASQQGNADLALPYLTAALRAEPNRPQHWLSLATALLRADRLPDARTILTGFVEQGFSGPALDAVKANLVEMLLTEARCHYKAERLAEAEALLDTVILLDSAHGDAVHLAGIIATKKGRLEHAYYLLTTAVALNSESGACHSNLGNVLGELGWHEQALQCYEQALRLIPDEAELHSNCGVILHKLGRMQEAIDQFRRAQRLDPRYVNSYSNLGVVLKDIGKVEEAIACYDEALRLNPNLAYVHSNRLFAKMYSADVSPLDQLEDAKSYGERHADPLLRRRPFANCLDTARKLRVGFVSADFRNHVVNFFFEPLISHFDRTQFETFAYSHTISEDEATERLKTHFDQWHAIRGLNDEETADLIENDRIDILVDLSGHTAGNRLLVFARKPAPIQVHWIGYPGSPGIKAMDYRIVDELMEPTGLTDHLSVEALWRLPDLAMSYQANPNSPAVIDHPPSDDTGFVTFGSINRFTKVTDPVLATWGEILARVPDARLLLEIAGIDEPAMRSETEARFERLGLPLDRVIFEARKPENQYVLYNRVDIALDPFPYNGGTTSLDSLWMGVPYIALEGSHIVSRMGSAILTTVGLPELVARTADEYADVAARLALDANWLRAVRHDLRGRMQRSPAMDHQLLADNMGAAFRSMWKIWVDRSAAARAL